MIEIVFPKPEDAEAIQMVFYKSWLDTYPNKEVGITIDDVEHWYKDDWNGKIEKQRARIANPPENQSFFIAKDGDNVVGVCRIVKYPDKNQLQAIYVLPDQQRKGIGKMLWDKALEILDPSKDTIVQVADYNKKAIEFYKKLGFVDTGKRFSDEHFRMKSGAIIPEMEMIIKSH